MGRLLTIAEVAEFLHLHPRTIARLVASGALRSLLIGSARRIDEADLADFLRECRQQIDGRKSTHPSQEKKNNSQVGPHAIKHHR